LIGVLLAAALSLHPCKIGGETARCGMLRVPEKATAARRLELNLVVLPHFASPPREPLFVLAGGPGQAATTLAGYFANVTRAARRHHDVVIVDQRGTGGTNKLDCVVAPRTFFVPLDSERCLGRLQRQADLTAYGTENFVDDIDAARAALAYERVSFYAASYGTRAAVAYARRFPAHVTSLVLVAPAPLNLSVLDEFVETSDSADPYYALGTTFLRYSSETAPVLNGDRAAIDAAIESAREQLLEQLAIGLHLTIMCSEELPLASKDTVARREYERACRDWPRVALPATFHTVPKLDQPALIIAGERDPVTTPRLASIEAEQFTHSRIVIFPKAGHLMPGMDATIGKLMAEFLDLHSIQSAALWPTRPNSPKSPNRN
jgi:pimeloyl-ACP methyl ester carboxylesterase